MATQRDIRAALPSHIPYYVFYGETMMFHSHLSCPGKAYLDPKHVLIRIYSATMASQGGFSGEIIALGDHVDSFSVNDYVFGGGLPCLQQYIVVRADSVALKPQTLSFTDAARLYAVTPIYDLARKFDKDLQVLILGDMTGFAVQFARERGCIITSSEDFDCGEDIIIEEDNYLTWLENHTNQFDIVIDASGDLELFAYSEIFTSPQSEFCSVNPESKFEAARALFLPPILGGVPRKLVIARPPKRGHLVRTLLAIAKLLLDNEIHILNPRVVSYEHINTIMPSQRYVTSVNIIRPEDHSTANIEVKKKDKGKQAVRPSKHHSRSSSTTSQESRGRHLGLATANPYSPRRSSKLVHSISAPTVEEDVDEQRLSAVQNEDVLKHRGKRRTLSNKSTSGTSSSSTANDSENNALVLQPGRNQQSSPTSSAISDEAIELKLLPSSNYIADAAMSSSVPRHLQALEHKQADPQDTHTQQKIEALQRQIASLMQSKENAALNVD